VSTEGVQPTALTGRTLADRVFEWLEEAIIKGEIKPETKLDEASLAKSFGISRGPLREAIRRLEGKKLVERVPHIGARVVALSHGKLTDLLFVREALEGMACRLAAERMSDGELRELDELLKRHAGEGSLKAGDHYFQRPGDFDFHYRIIHGSKNPKLIALSDDLYHLLRIHRYRSSSRKGRAAEALHEHRAIVKAMLRRDPEAAESRMREHLAHARRSIEDEVAEASAKPPKRAATR
jgi:DNA-binding GntR family transcriptional regulator